MKKRIVSLILLIAVCCTAGCSSPSTAKDNSEEIEALKDQIKELEKENADLKEQLASASEAADPTEDQSEPTADQTEAKQPESDQESKPISVGETITTDNMEITINKVELVYDVLPDDTSGIYTHYEADPGNVYLHIDTDVKNLGKQNLSCDDILQAVADYNGGYTYSGFAVPEDSNTGFGYANITSIGPLETLGMHFMFSCPQEVEESNNPLFITLEPSYSSDRYILTVR